jgi:pimeloyl-ACP methyl ester carboxylesterase
MLQRARSTIMPSQEHTTVHTVLSKDGTHIAFERLGAGSPIILVCGQSTDRSANAPLAALLAQHCTVFNYDRRGRGDSGDTLPYAVEHEVEDLDAMIDAAGGSAYVYGTSSGGALALEAAASGLAISKLALWEPPFAPAGYPRPRADLAQFYTELIAAGRRGDVIEYFMTKVVGLPAEFAAQARHAPWWPAQEALAHTLVYDTILLGDSSVPIERAAAVPAPTLVLTGGASFPFMAETAHVLVNAMPDAQHRTLEGQQHNVDPAVLAPVLAAFLST